MNKKLCSAITAVILAAALLLSACGVSGPTGTAPRPDGTTLPQTTSQPTNPPTTQPTEPHKPDTGCAHADTDGDALCDSCGIDVIVELNFYAINDLHGVFCDTEGNPGVDELTTYFKDAYADDSAYEILLSSGDMWQGSVESSSNKGALMTQWMNEVGFVSMTLGNHEYDWGSAYIADNAEIAEFPFLGINVTDSNVDTPYCQPSVVVERGGVRIGIIGAIGNVLSSISGEFTDGLSFAARNDLTNLVKAEAQRLRREENCHFIVYSIHDGHENSYGGIKDHFGTLGYYDLSLSEGYIDLVFEGHSHMDYVIRDKHGVYHIQGGGYNSAMSYVGVTYDLVNCSYEIHGVETLSPGIYGQESLADDPIVETLYQQYFPQEDPYTTVLGRNNVTRSSSDIAKVVAQLYLEKGRQLWGDRYEIVLGGGFIKCRSPYNLSAGDVTYSQLFSLLPFDNALVLCQVTGQQLKDKMLGSSSYYCAYDEDLRGSIDESKTYYIVTDTYTSFYKYNMFTELERLENFYARDLLRDYIAAGNWGGQALDVTIQEANAIGQGLEPGASTQQQYRLTGTITAIENDRYGNLYISDGQGNTLYLYGLYDSTGRIRYDAMESKPQVGDEITVCGAITKYVDRQGNVIIEIKDALLQG